ncbi:hypothetical protein CK203_100240 [Vitis vinifera]|uniref:Uncharacterized protein n=1 Tax=Vitis vinifera TaxID=29760 RepID=A0A438FIB3_VITVI|nr:hypothetical protein CK203_100240 [Vitis vinifera]
MHPKVEEETEIRDMKDELDPHRRDHPLSHLSPSFLTQRYHLRHLHALDHASWMDLSAQISSLDTRMEELAVQAIFEHLQQRIERIESRQESQHEEMMAYLRSVFPPP